MSDKHNTAVGVILDAVEYAKIAQNTPVINMNQLGYKVNIHLSEDNTIDSELYRIDELLPDPNDDINYCGFIIREGRKPWLDVLTEWLNTCQGQHIYRLSFVNVRTDQVFSLYISYIIQEDHPKQDYVYMERYDETN